MPAAGRFRLTAEQIEPISPRLEEDYDLTTAADRYREAAPDASPKEAKQYVIALYMVLRRQHPEKFAPRPLSLSTLNWGVMWTCAWIEAVVIGVLWLAMPPPCPVSAVSQFAYSFLFGLGLIAGLRVKVFGSGCCCWFPPWQR